MNVSFLIEVGWSSLSALFFILAMFKSLLLVFKYLNKPYIGKKLDLYMINLTLKPTMLGLIFVTLNKIVYNLTYTKVSRFEITYFSVSLDVIYVFQLFIVGLIMATGIGVGVSSKNYYLLLVSILSFVSINIPILNIIVGCTGFVLTILYVFKSKPRKDIYTTFHHI